MLKILRPDTSREPRGFEVFTQLHLWWLGQVYNCWAVDKALLPQTSSVYLVSSIFQLYVWGSVWMYEGITLQPRKLECWVFVRVVVLYHKGCWKHPMLGQIGQRPFSCTSKPSFPFAIDSDEKMDDRRLYPCISIEVMIKSSPLVLV